MIANRNRPTSRRPSYWQSAFQPRLEALEERLLLATRTWTGLGPDNNWTTAANWDGGIAPSPGDDLVFPGGAAQLRNNNDFAAETAFGSITLLNSGSTPYLLGGNALTLLNGISDESTNSPSNGVEFYEIVLGADQTFLFQNPNGELDFQTRIDLRSFTLTLDGAASVSPQGAHLSRPISGDGNLVKDGTGEWFLNADNTYNGTATVNAGRLVLSTSNGLGSTVGGTVVNPGGNLGLEADPNPITVNEPLILNGDGVPSDPTTRGALATAFSLFPVIYAGPIALASPSGIFAAEDPGSSVNQFVLSGTINTQGNDLRLEGPLATIVQGTITGEGRILQESSLSLAGTGTITCPLTISSGALTPGTLATDNSVTPGVLSCGQVALQSGSTFRVQINGTQVGGNTGYSQLSTDEAVNLNNCVLRTTLGAGFVPPSGADFTIIQSDVAVNGTFAGLPDGQSVTFGGQAFIIHYQNAARAPGARQPPLGRVILFAAPVSTAVDIVAPPNGMRFAFGQASISVSAQVVQPAATGLGLRQPVGLIDTGIPVPGNVMLAYQGPNGFSLTRSLTLVNGQVTDSLPDLAAGTYTVTATYAGFPDDRSLYLASAPSMPLTFTVDASGAGGGGGGGSGGSGGGAGGGSPNPPVPGQLQEISTPAGPLLFAIRDDHSVYEHDASGWRPVGLSFIDSIGATASASGNTALFATTQGHDLFLFEPARGLVNTGLRFIQSVSATTDSAGNPVIFAVTEAHDLFEYGPAFGLVPTGLRFIQQISATTDSAGNPLVFALTDGHDLFSFGPTAGLVNLNSRFLAHISAAHDATTGQAVIYATTQGEDLFYFDALHGWLNLNSRFIKTLSAGTDSAGQPEVYAITAAGDVAKNDAQRAWSILRPPKGVSIVQGLGSDRLLGRSSDGSVLQYDGSTGLWTDLGVPGS